MKKKVNLPKKNAGRRLAAKINTRRDRLIEEIRESILEIIKKSSTVPKEDWRYCDPCQVERGGKMPRGGFVAITVTHGTCSRCGKEATLIPNDDYNWPGKRAIFD